MIMGAALSQEVIILQCQPPKQLCNKGRIKTKQGAVVCTAPGPGRL